jgi:hypothetical protein
LVFARARPGERSKSEKSQGNEQDREGRFHAITLRQAVVVGKESGSEIGEMECGISDFELRIGNRKRRLDRVLPHRCKNRGQFFLSRAPA